MIKKIIFFLSAIVFTLCSLISIDIWNGKKVRDFLYKDMNEIHVTYNDNVDYVKFIDDLNRLSTKLNISISQYNFTSRNELSIITTNTLFQKNDHLIDGSFPQENENRFVANYKTHKSIGYINLPRNYLKIKLFSFEQIRNMGIGNIFYLEKSRNSDVFISEIEKYGVVRVDKPTISDTTSINFGQVMLLNYIGIFFLLCVITLAISQRKIIALKKMLGYSASQTTCESLNEIMPLFYGFVVSIIITMMVKISDTSIVLISPIIICFSLMIIISIMYLTVIFLIFKMQKISETVKGKLSQKIILFILGIILCSVISLFLVKSIELQEDIKKLTIIRDNDEIWLQTKNMYKTNITNQLNRNNIEEEKKFMKNAQIFYQKASEKHETFIMAPYNFEVIDYDKNNQPIFVGQSRGLEGSNYITKQGGIDVTVDVNYLNRNPIKFVNAEDKKKLNLNVNTLYLLVPEMYKKYEEEIKVDYLADVKFFLEEEPPNDNIDFKTINIEILYILDDQEFFTYNMYYGDEYNNYHIKNPIAVIVNPKLMSGLFWGNILTMNGGLFFDFSNKKDSEAFDLIKNEVDESGLHNTLNFTISVFKEKGETITRNNEMLINKVGQIIVLIILTCTINFQIVSIFFRLNFKKIFIKRIFGYSFLDQVLDVVFVPILLEITTLFIVQLFHSINLLNMAIMASVILLNILWFYIIYEKSNKLLLKEDIYDN